MTKIFAGLRPAPRHLATSHRSLLAVSLAGHDPGLSRLGGGSGCPARSRAMSLVHVNAYPRWPPGGRPPRRDTVHPRKMGKHSMF